MIKKICHLTSVHNIDDIRIFTKECTSLANRGFDVTLIACGNEEFVDVKNNVKRISLKIPTINRLHRILKRPRIVYNKAIEVDAEIYHLHDPELIIIGNKLIKRGKKVIFDSHEDIPNQILCKEWIPKIFRKILAYLYVSYTSNKFHNLSGLVTVNTIIEKKLKKYNNNVVQISNYPRTDGLYIKEQVKERAICFAGSISQSYMIHNIMTALSELDNIKLILAGEDYSGNYIQQLQKMKSWSNVEYLGKIPFNEVQNVYSRSQAGISLHAYTPNVGGKEGGLGFIKNFEFMAAGIPFICTDFRVWKKIIEEEHCGIYVNPYDLVALRSAIKYLLENPDTARKMGENGRLAVSNKYNWSIEEDKLITFYNNL